MRTYLGLYCLIATAAPELMRVPHGGIQPQVAVDSTGNYVDVRSGKLVAIVGVSNLVVVETKDALLIANRNQAQKVSDVVKMLETMRRDDLL